MAHGDNISNEEATRKFLEILRNAQEKSAKKRTVEKVIGQIVEKMKEKDSLLNELKNMKEEDKILETTEKVRKINDEIRRLKSMKLERSKVRLYRSHSFH